MDFLTSANFDPLVYLPTVSRQKWADFLQESPDMANAIRIAGECNHPMVSFSAELFSVLFGDPERLDIDDIKPEASWAKLVHDQLIPELIPEFRLLRLRCRGDVFMGGKACELLMTRLMAVLPTPYPFIIPDIKKIRDQIQVTYDAFAITTIAEEATLPPEVRDLLDHLRDRGRTGVQAAMQHFDKVDPSTLRKELRQVIQEAHDLLDDLAMQMNAGGWGGDSWGFNPKKHGSSLKVKFEHAQTFKNSKKLQEMAKLAGRLQLRAARKQRAKTLQSPQEIVGIESGDNLARMVTGEVAMMAIPELHGQFAVKLTEHNLTQYQLGGMETETQGPICICLDSSASMAGRLEIFSKAVLIALMTIAAEQGRHVRVIHFGERVFQVDDWSHGELNSKRFLESLRIFFDGDGTNWSNAIDAGVEGIRTHGALHKADIILITDGECTVNDTWVQELKQSQAALGFMVWGVLLGDIPAYSLEKFCDRIVVLPYVDDGDDEAIDAVFEI